MKKVETRALAIAAFDDIVKGAITLVVTAVVTRLVDDSYDKFVVARRYANLKEVPNVKA